MLVLLSIICKAHYCLYGFGVDQLNTLKEAHQISITNHILTRTPQMNNPTSTRAPITKGVHMGHHIMAKLAFVLGCQLHILIRHLKVRPHLVELFIGDIQPARLLGLGDR